MLKWYEESNYDVDVVISSRVQLVRNLKTHHFSKRLTEEGAKSLVNEVSGCMQLLKDQTKMPFVRCLVNELSDLEKGSFVEWNTISPLLAEKKQTTGLLLAENESISVMINEEDHIKIQVVNSGMNLLETYECADRVDDILSESLSYAFDDKYGYLTTSPTSVGTGLKASYVLFLPALTMAGKMQRLAEEVAKYGISIRGVYGEGTKSVGYLYEFSNQKTLGSTERELLENLSQIVKQAVIQERKRREYLISMNGDEIEDKIYRSYGVLRYAKKLNTVDAMMLLAQLKLGIDSKLIKLKEPIDIYTTMMNIQPINLQKIVGKSISSGERDRFRAEFLNEKISELRIS